MGFFGHKVHLGTFQCVESVFCFQLEPIAVVFDNLALNIVIVYFSFKFVLQLFFKLSSGHEVCLGGGDAIFKIKVKHLLNHVGQMFLDGVQLCFREFNPC